jgi:hypothetical protein
MITRIGHLGLSCRIDYDDDDDVYLIKYYNMAVGYKIYFHTNTDQPEHDFIKCKMSTD